MGWVTFVDGNAIFKILKFVRFLSVAANSIVYTCMYKYHISFVVDYLHLFWPYNCKLMLSLSEITAVMHSPI